MQLAVPCVATTRLIPFRLAFYQHTFTVYFIDTFRNFKAGLEAKSSLTFQQETIWQFKSYDLRKIVGVIIF